MTTRDLLIHQRNRLVELMTAEAEDWAKVRAKAMVRRIDDRLVSSDAALEASRGLFGDNGWGPQVDDICRLLAYRPSPELAAKAPALRRAA